VSENKVLRRILGPNRDEVIGGSIKLHNEELHNLYSSLWLYGPVQALAASMKLSFPFQLLDIGQSVGHLGRVINYSQGLYLYTNTEKRPPNTNIKHPCPEFDSNPRFRRPRERRQFLL
jgi:hypothetical protein